MVVFHMRLMGTQGIVKVRRFRQNCKRCNSAPMEKPSITSDNIEILLENLVKKIRIKCYNETLDGGFRPPASLNVNNPHEPSHCESCILGICNRNWTCVSWSILLSIKIWFCCLSCIYLTAFKSVLLYHFLKQMNQCWRFNFLWNKLPTQMH